MKALPIPTTSCCNCGKPINQIQSIFDISHIDCFKTITISKESFNAYLQRSYQYWTTTKSLA